MTRSPVAALGSRDGLTLLEVMIALVILGLAATGFLETFAGALRATSEARIWAQALVYAEEAQETLKIGGLGRTSGADTALGGGFRRRVKLRPWRDGIEHVTVVVTLPGGGEFAVDRLVRVP